jgi:uracil-DNA glycosylase
MTYSREQLAELELLPYMLQSPPPRKPVSAPAKDALTSRFVTDAVAKAAAPKVATPNTVAANVVAPKVATSKVAVEPLAIPAVAIEPLAIPATQRSDTPLIMKADWNALRAYSKDCMACGLCKARKQAVLGVGSQTPGANPWLFIGEGPGAEEDEQGEPFVGQAGKLLESMLFAMGLKRSVDVYIANVVKCRPPNNRTPSLEEAAACAPFLDRQIELIQPKLIVALGRTAVVRLLGRDSTMGDARGKQFDYKGIPWVATYHPSYLLRSPEEKRKAWDDLLLAKRVMAQT